jgi:ADP-ribose pyrophosphatase
VAHDPETPPEPSGGDAPPEDLTEHCIASERVFDGVLLHVRRDRVRVPDGHESIREYVVHPGAVAVLPVFDDGSLLMVRQFRYPLRREFIELPAGKIDAGEATLRTGQRELLEETGYVADAWTYLNTIHPVIGYADEKIEIWMARGLRQEGAKLDHGEFLVPFRMTLADALDAIRDQRITDVKTIIGVFWAERVLSGAWTPPPAPQP